MHIDTKVFCEYITDRLKNRIKFVDDVVTRVRVNTECNKIENIECKYSGLVEADLFVDASGFNAVLFNCLLYTSPSPRDGLLSRMPSSA